MKKPYCLVLILVFLIFSNTSLAADDSFYGKRRWWWPFEKKQSFSSWPEKHRAFQVHYRQAKQEHRQKVRDLQLSMEGKTPEEVQEIHEEIRELSQEFNEQQRREQRRLQAERRQHIL